jgi:hypothetical protein
MKRFTAATLLVGLGLGVLGCNSFPWRRDPGPVPVDNTIFTKREPQVPELVAYMNSNAQKVQGVRCDRVVMDCKQGDQIPLGIDGMLACQRPRQFRLKGKVGGSDQVDIGSNDDEFWYWVGKADPHVFHCSYKDMATGQVFLPFPFNPDMVVCALNIAEYDPKAHYEMRKDKDNKVIELIEPTKSMQGQDVFKVTVFNRGEVTATRPRVLAYLLKDRQGKDICRAEMLETQVNRETGAVLPVKVNIVFFGKTPAENSEMKLTFVDLKPTTFSPDSVARLFSRNDLSNLQGYDLARRAPDRPTGTGMSGVRQASGMDR